MLLVLVSLAAAHEPGLSRLVVTEDAVRWSVASEDPVPGELLRKVSVARSGEACSQGPLAAGPSGDDGAEHSAPLACPRAEGPLDVVVGVFGDLPPGHRVLVESPDAVPVGWVDALHATIQVPTGSAGSAPPGAGAVALQYLGLGVEHILTGWDHLLFLTGLLLGVRTFRDALAVVTGFTVAHSITLTLAALQVVVLPAAIVEPAIALTVVWVGIENLLTENIVRRVILTTTLGLVHGLGFAGLLADLGLPQHALVPALLSFNVGVELGQFGVVALVLPILSRLRELEGFRTVGLKVASGVVCAVGLLWFVERIVG